MTARMVVEFGPDRKLLFGGQMPASGLSEVALTDDIARFASDRFQGALSSLGDLVSILEQSIGQMTNRPDKVEMEFGASLTGDCDLWIVSGEGTAEFKVTLGWEKSG